MVYYEIEILSQYRSSKRLVVVDGGGRTKRHARFETLEAAEEACRIIDSLRSDKTYWGWAIIKVTEGEPKE